MNIGFDIFAETDEPWCRFPREREFRRLEVANPDFFRQVYAALPTLYRLYRTSDWLWSYTPASLFWLLDWRDYHSVCCDEELFEKVEALRRRQTPEVETARNELTQESFRRMFELRSEIPEEALRERIGTMVGETIMASLAMAAYTGPDTPTAYFRNLALSSACAARSPIMPPGYVEGVQASLGALANLKRLEESKENSDIAALAAVAGVDFDNLVRSLRSKQANANKEDIEQEVWFRLIRTLRRWNFLEQPALIPYLAKSAILDSKAVLRRQDEQRRTEKTSVVPNGCFDEGSSATHPAMAASPEQMGMSAPEELRRILRRIRLTPAEKRACIRRLKGAGPLSAADKMAMNSLYKKARTVATGRLSVKRRPARPTKKT